MKRFKVVLADNDGTLVNDDHQLTDRTRKALERLHEAGYLFGIASGRTIDDLKTYPSKWGLSFDFDIIIGLNGAELYDSLDDTVTREGYLSTEKTKEIVEKVTPFNYTMQYTRGKHYYFNRLDDFARASMSRNGSLISRVTDDISDFWSEEVPKIIVRLPVEEMAAFEQYWKDHPIEGVVSFKTQPFVYEFMAEGTDKKVAMHHFCEKHGIALDEVISFGDTTNDNGMLRDSYGVCMANGSPDTKATAEEITELTNNEDGFADYVEKHLL